MLHDPATASARPHRAPCVATRNRPVEAKPVASLPAWADTPEGRELCALIVAERPSFDCYDRGEHEDIPLYRYSGRTAAQLRRLWSGYLNPLMAEEARLYDAKQPFDHLHAKVMAAYREQPDALIARLLGEPVL